MPATVQVRFEKWPKIWLIALGCLIFSGIALSLALPQSRVASNSNPANAGYADVALYQDIAQRVANGENYYTAAITEQRAHDYPLHPFVTVRLPTQALILANFDKKFYTLAMGIIGFSAMLVWGYRISEQTGRSTLAVLIVFPIMLSTTALGFTKLDLLHESAAALLIALAIAMRTADRFFVSALLALFAALLRETAIAFPAMMLVLALWEKKYREATMWAIVLAIFGIVIVVHANMVAAVISQQDLHSPGWSGLLGWAFALDAIRSYSVLIFLPYWVTALILPMSLVGWLFWRAPTGLRAFGIVCGYTLMVALFARANTSYWAIMITPLLISGSIMAVPVLGRLAGLIFAPAAVRQT